MIWKVWTVNTVKNFDIGYLNLNIIITETYKHIHRVYFYLFTEQKFARKVQMTIKEK